MVNQPKIIFFGTPIFGAIVLEALTKSEFKPIAIVTEPDKPVGRKQILTPPPVKETAIKYDIPVLQPESLSTYQLINLSAYQPDLIIVAAYGKILPKEILDISRLGSLNIHPSLLPKYRGASPIQTAILNGDKETGVTIILMDEKIDHGPIVAQRQWEIRNPKSEILNKELAELGSELLIEILPKWLAGEIRPVPQDDSQATYTHQIKKEDGKIDWQKTAEEIERMTRAYWPWPSAYTIIQNPKSKNQNDNSKSKILKIIKAAVFKIDHQKKPGTVFFAENKQLAVACSKDALILEELQLEGKRPMGAQEFLNGHPEIIDSTLY